VLLKYNLVCDSEGSYTLTNYANHLETGVADEHFYFFSRDDEGYGNVTHLWSSRYLTLKKNFRNHLPAAS
jgi:hypothetical protein